MNLEITEGAIGITPLHSSNSIPTKTKITPRKHDEIPVLNRAQRRALKRYIRYKAKRQAGIVRRRYALEGYGERCRRCNLFFLGPTQLRCQCQVQQRRRCVLCDDTQFLASQREWRQTNVCPGCAAQIAAYRENEDASRSAVYDAPYEQRKQNFILAEH